MFLITYKFSNEQFSILIDNGPHHSTCVSANKLDVLLDVEKRNSDGEIKSKAATSRKPRKNKKKSNHGDGEDDTDKDDHNFLNTDLGTESSSNEHSVREEDFITNIEVGTLV